MTPFSMCPRELRAPHSPILLSSLAQTPLKFSQRRHSVTREAKGLYFLSTQTNQSACVRPCSLMAMTSDSDSDSPGSIPGKGCFFFLPQFFICFLRTLTNLFLPFFFSSFFFLPFFFLPAPNNNMELGLGTTSPKEYLAALERLEAES